MVLSFLFPSTSLCTLHLPLTAHRARASRTTPPSHLSACPLPGSRVAQFKVVTMVSPASNEGCSQPWNAALHVCYLYRTCPAFFGQSIQFCRRSRARRKLVSRSTGVQEPAQPAAHSVTHQPASPPDAFAIYSSTRQLSLLVV